VKIIATATIATNHFIDFINVLLIWFPLVALAAIHAIASFIPLLSR
jgi:hypothetical protein